MKSLVRQAISPPHAARIDAAMLRRLDDALAALSFAEPVAPADLLIAPARHFVSLRHELSDDFIARRAVQLRLRTPAERRALDEVGAFRLHRTTRSRDDFEKALLELARLAAPGAQYRQTKAWLAPDAAGVAVELPPPEAAVATLDQLRRFLRSGTKSIGLAAATALVLTVNAHPFTDGNGRSGRMLFNAVLRTRFPTAPYLPLSEICQRSDGGYEIALRQAEIRGEWAPLLEFMSRVAELCTKPVLVPEHV